VTATAQPGSNMQRFAGRVAVITGGASGIGLATARQIVAEAGRVVIGDLNHAAGAAAVAELGADNALFQTCDVAQHEQVEALVALAEQRFGGVDVLVNNAGIGSDLCSVDTLSIDTWRRVISVDLDAVFFGCKSVIPRLRARGGGAIVNVASISGLGGDYGFNAYNAAKGAVVNFTRSLAMDHARDNIRVNALCPGLIDTPLSAFMAKRGVLSSLTDNIPMKRVGRADEMAKVITFLASDDASYVTGSIVVADGGLTAGTGNPDLAALLQRTAAKC
jgi:meso-butanediol dehydrogenase / (S,S)-butanediol dehydrogenase / diacetyl reductase